MSPLGVGALLDRGLHDRRLAHPLLLELANRIGNPTLFEFELLLPGSLLQLNLATEALLLGEPARLCKLEFFILTVLEGSLYNLRLTQALLFKGANGIGQTALFLVLATLAFGIAPLPFLLGQALRLGQLPFLQPLLLECNLLDDLMAPALHFCTLIGHSMAGLGALSG